MTEKAAPAARAAAPAAKPAPAAPPKTSPIAAAKVRYEPSKEEIQARAFEIYLAEGCKEGNDLENWLRAEKELRTQSSR